MCGKGRGYTVYIESLRVALNLDSNKFRSFNHREKLDSTVQFQFSSVAYCSWCVLYIEQGSLYNYIHGIMSAKRMHEVRPLLLVRESSMQLIMYTPDTGV